MPVLRYHYAYHLIDASLSRCYNRKTSTALFIRRSGLDFGDISMSALKLSLFSVLLFAATTTHSAEDFSRLVNRLPRSANAVLILNVDKALASPTGKFEGWQDNIEKSFESGISRVPPGAKRFVLAAELDFDYLKPMWEAAVIDAASPISLPAIAKKRGGATDTIETLSAVALPEDVYLIQFDDQTLGAIGPANRKMATTWLRDIKAGLTMSNYLSQAASYSDATGSEIILAVDLDGAYSLESIVAYLKQKPAVTSGDVNIQKAAKFLADVKGLRLGIRLTQPPTAAIAVDCGSDVGVDAATAKNAFIQVLSDGGMLLPEVREWKCTVKGNEVSLNGKLTRSGLRRVLSIVESPTASEPTSVTKTDAKAPATSTDPKKQMADATLKQYRAVTEMFDDLKGEMKDAANLAVTTIYFDRYAKRIERLPVLDVDPDMLDYSSYVASSLRAASGSVRQMGIRGSAREAQVTSSDVGYDYSYGYRSGWNGGDGVSTVKAVGVERRKVRAEEKGIAATDVHKIRADVIDATAKIRRAMTEKYRVEF